MHIERDDWKSKCEVCHEEITFGKWKCAKRQGNHKSPEKVYFHLGGAHIQHPREKRGWSPAVVLRAGTEATNTLTGEKYLVPTIRVVFSQQTVVTTDPEIQYYLDTKNDLSIAWGDEGQRLWQKIYLTPDQQSDLAKAELDRVNTQIREQNALLDSIKGRTKGKEQVSA